MADPFKHNLTITEFSHCRAFAFADGPSWPRYSREKKPVPEDLEHRVEYVLKEDNPGATFDLGMSFYTGQGAPKDYQEAVKWFLLATKRGHREANRLLATCFEHGYGVARNPELSARYQAAHGDERIPGVIHYTPRHRSIASGNRWLRDWED